MLPRTKTFELLINSSSLPSFAVSADNALFFDPAKGREVEKLMRCDLSLSIISINRMQHHSLKNNQMIVTNNRSLILCSRCFLLVDS